MVCFGMIARYISLDLEEGVTLISLSNKRLLKKIFTVTAANKNFRLHTIFATIFFKFRTTFQ